MNNGTFTKCHCGKVYEGIPKDALLFEGESDPLAGYYFNCACRTTLFWPAIEHQINKVDSKAAAPLNGRYGTNRIGALKKGR